MSKPGSKDGVRHGLAALAGRLPDRRPQGVLYPGIDTHSHASLYAMENTAAATYPDPLSGRRHCLEDDVPLT